jgi:hypothetical protein
MSLLGVAPGAIVGVGGELGLLTARGEAVAGAAMIAVGVGMVGADYLPNLGAAMIGAGSVPVAREVYRMVTADAPAELPAAPVAEPDAEPEAADKPARKPKGAGR